MGSEMEHKAGESSKPKLERRPSPLQSSAAFLHHLHTDPKSHHITLSAGLTRQPSAPPTARSPQPVGKTLEAPEGSGSLLEPPQPVTRKVSKRSRPRTAPSAPREEKDASEQPGPEPVDIPEGEDASCVIDFMRQDQMAEAMDILSVSDTPRGNSGTLLVGRAGHASPRPIANPLLSPPVRRIESLVPTDKEAIGWREFAKNYASGNFDPLHVPRPPVPTIHEPVSSTRSSPGVKYPSLDARLPTSSDTNSSAGSMATSASTVPSTAPSASPTQSADAVLTLKTMNKPRSLEAENLVRRQPQVKPSGNLLIPSYDVAAATVRMASASSGYGPESFAPLGVPSPDQELTDPMAGFLNTSTAKPTGNSDPSNGSRFPLSRSMSSAVDPDRRQMLQLPTIKASPASSPHDHPKRKESESVVSPPWVKGGMMRPHIPAATAPVEKTVEVEGQEDYFGDAVSPPPEGISRGTSYTTSASSSSQQTVTGSNPTPTLRRSKTPPPRTEDIQDTTPPRMAKWAEMGELYNKHGWLPAPLPPNEEARRRALYRFNILHSAPDVNFDRIAHMAKLVFNTKIVLIALIDSDVQWHKSQSGLGADEVNRVSSFCGHSILAKTDEPFVILDTQADWRFVNSPQVVGPPHVRFYAGAPLRTADGYNLGSLCVIDDKPRSEFTPRQRLILKEFAAVTIREMELWRDKLQLRVRDKIQNAMEKFTRECLEMDAKSNEKKADAAAKMDVVYESAASLVSSTLDLDGCFILDLDQFEATEVEGPDGVKTVYRADPYNNETDLLERSQGFGPITPLPLLASTDADRKPQPLSAVDHQRLSTFLSEHRDGKIYEHKPPSFVRGMFPDELRYAMVIPVFGVDSRPSTLICAHTSKSSKQYLEGYELQFLRAIGVIILSAVLRRRMVLADKAKSILISSVSHELRTPLHGILAAAELLADTELDQNQVAFLRTVQSCGNSLIETVNHVLDFTKLSGGSSGSGSSLKLSKVNLSTLIEQTAEGCWVGLRARTFMGDADVGSYYAPDASPTHARGRPAPGRDALPIEIVVDIAYREKGWNVRCEKGGLRRVLMNLIGNSLKFTKEGYIQVTLRELPHSPGSKTIPIEMAVIDTGKGIGKEFLKEQLFHPFSQENPLQTGTGLGLAIVNSIVRSEGVNGKVDVWSAEGMGTEIRVSFEATVIDEDDDSSNQSATSSQSSAFGGNHSVSLMGFDPSQRGHILSLDVLSTYACSWDFEIKDNADISIVHEDEPFARNQILHQKPVIYLSGSRRGEITDLANRTMKAGGFLQVLYKPIGPSALRDALSSAVNWLQHAPDLVSPLSPADLERPSVSRSSSDNSAASAESAESNSTISELASHKHRNVHQERVPLYRRRSEETEQKTVVPRPTMAPRGLTYHHAPPPSLTRKVSMAESETSQNSASPSSSTLSTISLADGGVMLKAAAQPLKAATKGQGPRVLVVEDNVINRRVLGAFLKKRKFEWAEAYDGQEGVDVFNSTPPNHWDVILMDISMPIMNGHEATRAIRKIESERRHSGQSSSTSTSTTPPTYSNPASPVTAVPNIASRAKIFALTGLATSEDKREAFSSGVDGYLVKPVSLGTLDSVFKRLGFH